MTDFEKWLEENYPVVGLDICEKEGDRYIHKPTRNMHDAYLAGQQSKEAAIQEMDEVIKLQDADLRKYEKQSESLKTQLAVYKEDMQKDAEKIADLEKYQRVNGECINNLVNQKHDYLHRVTMAIAHLDSFDLSQAGMNKLQRSIESALEALRGVND